MYQDGLDEPARTSSYGARSASLWFEAQVGSGLMGPPAAKRCNISAACSRMHRKSGFGRDALFLKIL